MGRNQNGQFKKNVEVAAPKASTQPTVQADQEQVQSDVQAAVTSQLTRVAPEALAQAQAEIVAQQASEVPSAVVDPNAVNVPPPTPEQPPVPAVLQPPAPDVIVPAAKTTFTPSLAASSITVAHAVQEDATVVISPMRTERSIRIGKATYGFKSGKRVRVPAFIIPHLKRMGIIA